MTTNHIAVAARHTDGLAVYGPYTDAADACLSLEQTGAQVHRPVVATALEHAVVGGQRVPGNSVGQGHSHTS